MAQIGLILMVAVVIEALVEYGKTIVDTVETREYRTAIIQGITIVAGIFLAFAFNLQLFNGALSEFYPNLTVNGTIDTVLTGILFSRGSNYMSNIFMRLTSFADKPFIDDVIPATDWDDEMEDAEGIDESEAK